MITCGWFDQHIGERCEAPAVWVFVGKLIVQTIHPRCAAHCRVFLRKHAASNEGELSRDQWMCFTPAVWERWRRLVRVRRYFAGEADVRGWAYE